MRTKQRGIVELLILLLIVVIVSAIALSSHTAKKLEQAEKELAERKAQEYRAKLYRITIGGVEYECGHDESVVGRGLTQIKVGESTAKCIIVAPGR